MFRSAVIASVAAAVSVAIPAAAQTDSDTRPDLREDRLAPVEVIGLRRADAPGAVAVLDADALRAEAADHPAELLNVLPGVNIQMNSGQEHLIALRSPVLTGGAGQGSVLILENGVPVRAPAFGNVNALFEPHFELADQVELIKGPGPARFGSNAVHGLIDVILPQDAAPFAEASVSTLERFKLAGRTGVGSGWIGASLQEDAGWRDDTGVSQQKLSARTAVAAGGWAGDVWATATNLNQETAGFIQGFEAYLDDDLAESNPNPEAGRDAWSARAAGRFERRSGNGTVRITPFALYQEMRFRQHFLPNQSSEENDHGAAGLMAELSGSSGRVEWAAGADAIAATGSLRQSQAEPFGFFPGDTRFPAGDQYDYTVDTLTGALWGEAAWHPAPRFTVTAGLRGEVHRFDYAPNIAPATRGRFKTPAARTDDFTLFTPKLGLAYQAGEALFFAALARGQRAPQASDLYRVQSQQGAGEADVETLDSLEIGVRGDALEGRARYQLVAYRAGKDGFFFRDADGLNVTDGTTRHSGIEADGAVQLASAFALSGSVAWSDQIYTFDRIVGRGTEIIRSGNRIDTAPEWLADLRLGWTASDALELGIAAEFVGEYFTDPANANAYEGHTLVRLDGRYAFGSGVEAFAILRNAFDTRYADRADFAFGNHRYFPGEPRNLTVGLRRAF